MKKAIKAIWHGIKAVFTAVVEWVATLFGIKENNKYGRVLRRIVGTAFAVVVIMWAVASLVRFGRNIGRNLEDIFEWEDDDYYLSEVLSEDLFFYDNFYSSNGYLCNGDGKKLLKHVSWVAAPKEGDSLVCYSDGNLRGYFHLRDGRQVVRPTYNRAWIFSEGMAAVEKNGYIKFIDTTGTIVIDRPLLYNELSNGYVFHHGHCAVNDSTGTNMGLIDRKGNWVIPPLYEKIVPVDTFWFVVSEEEQCMLTFSLDTVIPPIKAYLLKNGPRIEAIFHDHTMCEYSLDGKLVTAFQIGNVEQMMYDTRTVMYHSKKDFDGYVEEEILDEEPIMRKATATCLRYEGESGWYGLMTPGGKVLTLPEYTDIEAIGKDLYLCKTDYSRGVLLNSAGKRVE